MKSKELIKRLYAKAEEYKSKYDTARNYEEQEHYRKCIVETYDKIREIEFRKWYEFNITTALEVVLVIVVVAVFAVVISAIVIAIRSHM